MIDFRMPSLGADMEAGTLVQWVKKPGDALTRGDIIAVVDTQKGAIEVEVFEDGVLFETIVKPGEEVPVGTVLARIRRPDEPATAAAPAAPSAAAPAAASEAAAVAAGPSAPPAPIAPPPPAAPVEVPGPAGAPTRVAASPAARALAAQLGVDLARISGTGPGGAVTLDDVRRGGSGTAPSVGGTEPSTGAVPGPAGGDRAAAMRAAIAAAMTRSKREIPHYYLSTTIDLTAALAWMRAANGQRPVTERLLPAALLLKATALALRDVPDLNGYWIDGVFRPADGVHVGVAIALRGGGLVAPALHRADEMPLDALMQALQDLVARARGGALRSSELSDATITVTSLGEQGVDAAFGIIYPPQVAIVGFGAIARRPWVAPSGAVEAREVVVATLSADHRVTDGHRGGLFLAAVNRRLQEPERL